MEDKGEVEILAADKPGVGDKEGGREGKTQDKGHRGLSIV